MRRRAPKKHPILPDPKFGSVLVTSFVNNLMLDGKKSTAYSIFYDAMERVQQRTGEDGLAIFIKALEKCNSWCGSAQPSCGRCNLPNPPAHP